MNLSRSFDNVSSLQIFQVLRFGTLFLTSVFFTKFGMKVNDIGIYETLMLLSGSLTFFWVSGVISSLLAGYKTAAGERDRIFVNIFLILLGLSVLVFFAVRIFAGPVASLFSHTGGLPHLELFSWYILINTPTYLTEYIYLLKKKNETMLGYGAVIFILQMILVVNPVVLGFSLAYTINGLIVSAVLRFAWLIIVLFRYSEWKPDWKLIKVQLMMTLPLTVGTLLSGSSDYLDGIIVSNFFDAESFAVFRFGARELPITLLLANALSNAMVPVVANGQVAEACEVLKERSLRLMHLFFPLSIILMISSHWLYPVFYDSRFGSSSDIFNIYLLLIVSRMLFPQTILIGLKKMRTIMFVSFTELVINICFSILLLPSLGLAGVAAGTLIAHLSEKIMLIWYLRKSGINPNQYIDFKVLVLYACILSGTFIIIQKII